MQISLNSVQTNKQLMNLSGFYFFPGISHCYTASCMETVTCLAAKKWHRTLVQLEMKMVNLSF